MSRYAQPCPICGAIIPPGKVSWKPTFPCPTCGELLKIDDRPAYGIFAVGFLGAPLLAWYLGYQGAKLALVAGGILLLVLVSGFFLIALVLVPSYKPEQYDKSKPFDRVASMRLTTKPNADKKTNS